MYSPSTDVYFNLAAEEYALKQSDDSFFLLWQSLPSVVVGRHQYIPAEVDTEFAFSKHIRIARRYSGGGAVYQDLGNINLTFIDTVTRTPDFRSYLNSVTNHLQHIGLPVQADARMSIYLHGAKVSGSAQCVYKQRVLYHCTLLYNSDLPTLNRVLTPPAQQAADPFMPKAAVRVASVRSPVTNIAPYLPQSAAGIDRFKAGLLATFNGEECRSEWTATEENAILQLKEENYKPCLLPNY
jgi:lipoate-protein ligase A